MYDDDSNSEELSKEDTDQLLANAVLFLLQGEEVIPAELLLQCSDISISRYYNDWTIVLRGPRTVYDKIEGRFSEQNPYIGDAIHTAFKAIFPRRLENDHTSYRIKAEQEKVTVSKDWRREIKDQLLEPLPINQAPNADNIIVWNFMRFRSPAEVSIAKALEAANVLFFANPFGRLNVNQLDEPVKKGNREPDFLICKNGKWGILEVDGATYHTSAAKDQDKDRLFKAYGVKVIEHYDAIKCMQNPTQVVRSFLTILGNS